MFFNISSRTDSYNQNIWLILGDVKLHARLSSVHRDSMLDLIFFRYEDNCSHAYVDPNKVNTAILIRCSVWYVTGSAFQVLIISWSLG